MLDLPWLDIAFRWLHILPAMALFGGALFMRAALHPSLPTVRDSDRAALQAAVRARWARIVHLAIACLLISGTVNLVRLFMTSRVPTYYHALLGVKILLALAIFFLASVLTGRSALGEQFRAQAAKWTGLVLLLATLLIAISGVLRSAPHTSKSPAQQEDSASSSPAAATR